MVDPMGADGMAAQFSEYTWIVKNLRVRAIRGTLELHILRFLTNEPCHGYQLIKLFRRNHGVNFGPSTIYPALQRLEHERLIECVGWTFNGQKPTKKYRITALGLKVLNALQNEFAGEK